VTVPIIRVADVSKSFTIRSDKSLKERVVNFRRGREHAEQFWALRDVSFDVGAGKTLGIIGRNGSGKSTLLKIIGGILSPQTGYVERRGRLAALLELGAGMHTDLTGRENVYLNASILGLSRRQTEQYFDQIVEFSGIEEFIDTQVKFYSSGMYVRLAFAVAIHVDPEILLIDEVLAVGDEPFQRKCMERIKQFQGEGRTIVLVTHALDTIRQLCDQVLFLDEGRVVVDGTPVQALREFRDRFTVGTQLTEEQGTRRVEVVKVVLADGSHHPKDVFAPGDDLTIEIDCVAAEPTEDWVCGVAIHNQLDMLVYATNTKDLDIPLEPIHGRRRVRFTFRDIPLTEAQYFVTVAVHPKTGREYHRLDRTTAFRVESSAEIAGVVHMTPSFEVVE